METRDRENDVQDAEKVRDKDTWASQKLTKLTR